MKRKASVVALALILAVILPMSITTTSAVADSSSTHTYSDEKLIQRYVDDIYNREGVKLDPTDFEVKSTSSSALVLRKDSEYSLISASVAGGGRARGARFAVAASPPTAEQRRMQEANGAATIQQDTTWYVPTCQRSYDYHPLTNKILGYADWCFQHGTMNYAGSGTDEAWALRMWASCASNVEEASIGIKVCGVFSIPRGDGPSLKWTGWEPKSTRRLDRCEDITLGIAYGLVSASHTFKGCEKVDYFKGDDQQAGLFHSWWEANGVRDEKRETASLIGYTSPQGTTPEFWYDGYVCSYEHLQC
ncbi:hypothetical protein [Nonomuraea aurantiaca]|uniref:hypothetical protein n=1 Tax=Nonomuraea aurantiaca TaxID=2878562 RepID=UPI001CD9D81A|nr:hypothetical protein [Nonomuraea aurantiaca]MCA2230418.1 hypothetical protein [Nonomuraea aurantiaca]